MFNHHVIAFVIFENYPPPGCKNTDGDCDWGGEPNSLLSYPYARCTQHLPTFTLKFMKVTIPVSFVASELCIFPSNVVCFESMFVKHAIFDINLPSLKSMLNQPEMIAWTTPENSSLKSVIYLEDFRVNIDGATFKKVS